MYLCDSDVVLWEENKNQIEICQKAVPVAVETILVQQTIQIREKHLYSLVRSCAVHKNGRVSTRPQPLLVRNYCSCALHEHAHNLSLCETTVSMISCPTIVPLSPVRVVSTPPIPPIPHQSTTPDIRRKNLRRLSAPLEQIHLAPQILADIGHVVQHDALGGRVPALRRRPTSDTETERHVPGLRIDDDAWEGRIYESELWLGERIVAMRGNCAL